MVSGKSPKSLTVEFAHFLQMNLVKNSHQSPDAEVA
jgi:hypothetical protein